MNDFNSLNLKEGFYYFYKNDLFIKSRIININSDINGDLEVIFENGKLNIWEDTVVESVRRPSNIVIGFEWCYKIKNVYGDIVGYIGKPEV